MPQTVYSAAPAIRLIPGFRRESPQDVVHHGVLETVAGCEAGRFLLRGAAENSCDVLDAIGDVPKIVGVSCYEMLRVPSTPAFARYDRVAMLHKGKIHMRFIGAMAAGAIPFIIYTGADAGRVSATNVGGNTGIQVSGVVVAVGAGDGEIGEIEVDLPAIAIVVDT